MRFLGKFIFLVTVWLIWTYFSELPFEKKNLLNFNSVVTIFLIAFSLMVYTLGHQIKTWQRILIIFIPSFFMAVFAFIASFAFLTGNYGEMGQISWDNNLRIESNLVFSLTITISIIFSFELFVFPRLRYR